MMDVRFNVNTEFSKFIQEKPGLEDKLATGETKTSTDPRVISVITANGENSATCDIDMSKLSSWNACQALAAVAETKTACVILRVLFATVVSAVGGFNLLSSGWKIFSLTEKGRDAFIDHITHVQPGNITQDDALQTFKNAINQPNMGTYQRITLGELADGEFFLVTVDDMNRENIADGNVINITVKNGQITGNTTLKGEYLLLGDGGKIYNLNIEHNANDFSHAGNLPPNNTKVSDHTVPEEAPVDTTMTSKNSANEPVGKFSELLQQLAELPQVNFDDDNSYRNNLDELRDRLVGNLKNNDGLSQQIATHINSANDIGEFSLRKEAWYLAQEKDHPEKTLIVYCNGEGRTLIYNSQGEKIHMESGKTYNCVAATGAVCQHQVDESSADEPRPVNDAANSAAIALDSDDGGDGERDTVNSLKKGIDNLKLSIRDGISEFLTKEMPRQLPCNNDAWYYAQDANNPGNIVIIHCRDNLPMHVYDSQGNPIYLTAGTYNCVAATVDGWDVDTVYRVKS
jgi:hypothetical protein